VRNAKFIALRMAENEKPVMAEAGKLLNQQQMEVLEQYWSDYINNNLTEEEKQNPREAHFKLVAEEKESRKKE
jgi:hypothetical protein